MHRVRLAAKATMSLRLTKQQIIMSLYRIRCHFVGVAQGSISMVAIAEHFLAGAFPCIVFRNAV